ncbi:MAG TPA: UDP-N-acetylglucosamine 1-carboxyvinyltransferase [Opitutaceae bacterium]|nr:UDP-N-acetylglucosamine 1-carboxyvinyltransferase [Opitutaceae bacterium]
MADLIVNGGKPLSGTIRPSGNKNAVLPIFCASLLTDEPVRLTNVPAITDLEKLVAFCNARGSRIQWDRATGTIDIDHSGFSNAPLDEGLPEGMRSTVLLYPALLNRVKRLTVQSNTKGCSLGIRELDPHFETLRALGAALELDEIAACSIPGRFHGARHWADYMSVTATENFAMAAVLADGSSELINAASEPHVQDLCNALVAMGARIDGIGTSRLAIEGASRLHGAEIHINTDHHEVITFLALGAITGGEVRVEGAQPDHMDLVVRAFAKLGARVEFEGDTAIMRAGGRLVIEEPMTANLLQKIEAAPWPYFPVDLLPVMIALAVRAQGAIQFWNKIYEGGFTWLPELAKFGAHVVVSDPHRVIVFGNRPLRPAVVEAPYIIRAAVALYAVAASIPGRSVVKNADAIRRAHPRFVENLRALGASVEWS